MTKIIIALLLSNMINLSFEYRETAPYSLFPFYTAASDMNPLGHLSNPAYLPIWKAAYLCIDYGKPYYMEELNSGNMRAGYAFSKTGIQAAWNRFGIEEYSEDILEGNIGYRPWRCISAGIGISYYKININTPELKYKNDITDFRFSALLLPFDWISIAFTQDNFREMIRKEDFHASGDFLYPERSFGISLKPARGIALTWNINEDYSGYVNSFAITANMLPNLSLKGGYSRETCTYSLYAGIIYCKILASYGLSHHTYLGLTHKIGITIFSGNFSFEEINYNKKLFRETLPEKKKKIHINNSSYEELLESGYFSKEIAERITKYREAIGPVSEKVLIQIGLTGKELNDIRGYILGIAEDIPGKGAGTQKITAIENKAKTRKAGYDIETRKSLFQSLLENGLNAGTSLGIAEKAKSSSKTEIICYVNELPGIDNEKKKIIIKICSDLP